MNDIWTSPYRYFLREWVLAPKYGNKSFLLISYLACIRPPTSINLAPGFTLGSNTNQASWYRKQQQQRLETTHNESLPNSSTSEEKLLNEIWRLMRRDVLRH